MISLKLLQFRIALMVALLITILATSKLTVARPSIGNHRSFDAFSSPAPITMSTAMVGEARSVFQKVNAERKGRKLKALIWDEQLAAVASDYSRQMADGGFFDHYDPDGLSVVDRAESHKILNWKKLGENLFQCEGYKDPADTAVKGWMKSKTHRRNIVDSEWTHTGVGVFTTDEGVTYLTQVFMTK